MIILFNIIVLVVVGFIAYWWANQGVFSSLLHLLCVIVAGAVAIAFWEPITVGLLLRGGGFDNYAWGVALVGVFAVTLFVLRMAMDRIAPANITVPHWANLAFGGLAGAMSGVLTMGIFIIGAGHIQSESQLVGFRGWARSPTQAAQIVQRNRLWVPVHKLTSDFYSWLSVTSLESSQPLRHYTPELHRQLTLLRDSFGNGRKGVIAMKPDGAAVERLYYAQAPGGDQYFVEMNFGLGAQDSGEQLTLSSSQIRLIGQARGTARPEVVHPFAWRQYSGLHKFDDVTHYLISEPGKESARPIIAFETTSGFQPAFIQIRGTRYDLRGLEARPAPGNMLVTAGSGPATPATGGGLIQNAIRIANDIRPVSVSKNLLPSSIKERERYLTSGTATFPPGRGAGMVSRNLRIEGIYEPTGTKVVRLDVSRGSSADMFRFLDQVEEDAEIALVDVQGNEYTPVGYFHRHGGGITIRLEPTTRLRTIDDIPMLPSSGQQILELLFYVTEGTTITGFRFGDVDVGNCSLTVPKSTSEG